MTKPVNHYIVSIVRITLSARDDKKIIIIQQKHQTESN